MGKYTLYSLLFLCLLVNKEETTIPWNTTYDLQWSDFKGNPDYTTDAAAVTASGISYDLSATVLNRKTTVNCKVEAYFYPNESWYKKELADSVILAHERLHFDITEMYARKMRTIVDQTTFDHHVKTTVKKIFKSINKELDSMQKQYDKETDFSRDINAQNAWQEKISATSETRF